MRQGRNMEKLITIIVPVYNVAPYLRTCIDSIIQQTYKNLEIILVDDGSTDESSSICDEYIQKDNRVVVIHKENGGLSEARNVGIDIAKGDYIGFVDSDDFIEPDMYEVLYSACQINSAEISISGRYLEFETECKTTNLFCRDEFQICSNVEAMKKLLIWQDCDSAAWDKLYDAKLFTQQRYPVGVLHEDLNVTIRLFYNCKKIVFTGIPLYHYRIRENSICRSNFSEKKFDLIYQSCESANFARNIDISLKEEADYFEFRGVLGVLSNASDTICKKFKYKVLKMSIQCVPILFNNKYVSIRDRKNYVKKMIKLLFNIA